MNIKQIEYFVEVAKTLNYTKASQQLYISQSAITKQIFSLEEELGVELFIRNNKGVKLTLAGEIFLKDALDILHKIETTEKTIQCFKTGKEGQLNLGYVTGLERTSMISSIQQFYQKYPRCHINYDSDISYELKKKLLKEQVDMILTHRMINDPLYKNDMIFQSPIMVFVPYNSKYTTKSYFEKEDLSSLELISDTLGLFHDDIQSMEIDHLFLQVMGYKGVVILPEFSIRYTQFQDYLVGIPVKNMVQTIYAVYKKDNQNPLIQNFISILKDNF